MKFRFQLFVFVTLVLTACNAPTPAPTATSQILSAPSPGALGAAQPATVTLPKLIEIPVHAIRLSDADGSRQADITPGQVAQWVDKANQGFMNAGIHFSFQADENGPDWTDLNATDLNNLSSGSSAAWQHANDLASERACKLTVFFRHGSGANPTGNGFSFPPQSGIDTDFVAMPGFHNTGVVIGKNPDGSWQHTQNIWLFGHEVGHFLGMYHTFPGWEDNYYKAYDPDYVGGFWSQAPPNKPVSNESTTYLEQYIQDNGGDASAFDGDGLADTPPDPGAAYYFLQGWDPCVGHDVFSIGGIDFAPDRHNQMSYFACDPQRFSNDQAALLRSTAMSRFGACGENVTIDVPPVQPVQLLVPDPRPFLGPTACRLSPDDGGATAYEARAGQLAQAAGRTPSGDWLRIMPLAEQPRQLANGDWEEVPGPAAAEPCWVPGDSLAKSDDSNWLANLPVVEATAVSCSAPDQVAVGNPFSVMVSLSPAVPGTSVNVDVNLNQAAAQSGLTAVTDTNGHASVLVQPLLKAGTYSIVASANGVTSEPCQVEAVYPPAEITGHTRVPAQLFYLDGTGGSAPNSCGPSQVTISAIVDDADGFTSMTLVYQLVAQGSSQSQGPYTEAMSKQGTTQWSGQVDVEAFPFIRTEQGWTMHYSFDAVDHLGEHHYSKEWADVSADMCISATATPAPTSTPAIR